jgi:hypothetical protein
MDTETRVRAYDGTLRTIGRCEERLRCFVCYDAISCLRASNLTLNNGAANCYRKKRADP